MSDETTATPPPAAVEMHSATISKIADALGKAQATMGTAAKDATNPFFKSQYADLPAIRAAIREPLAANGLSFAQSIQSDKDGVAVHTLLMHTSGEWLRGSCWLPAAQKSAQAYGSAITYARRYSLAALVGVVADDDDDGSSATRSPEQSATVQNVKSQIRAQVTAAKAPAAEEFEEAPKPAAPPPAAPAAVTQFPDWAKKIKATHAPEELKALIPEIMKLPAAEQAKLKPLFDARRAELTSAAR